MISLNAKVHQMINESEILTKKEKNGKMRFNERAKHDLKRNKEYLTTFGLRRLI